FVGERVRQSIHSVVELWPGESQVAVDHRGALGIRAAILPADVAERQGVQQIDRHRRMVPHACQAAGVELWTSGISLPRYAAKHAVRVEAAGYDGLLLVDS